jgi:Neuraminidase (sialidase)
MESQSIPRNVFWVHPKCNLTSINLRSPFVILDNGNLLAIDCEAVCISKDDGYKWRKGKSIFKGMGGTQHPGYAMIKTKKNIVLVYMDRSTYKWEWDDNKRRASENTRLDVFSILSSDEGKTWKKRQKILDGYCGGLLDIIQTCSGNIVVPIQDLSPDRSHHVQYTFISKDDGETWTRSNMIDIGGYGHHDGAFESTLAELSDGRLLMLIRTSLDQFWKAYSTDGGHYWRKLEPSGIDASNSPGHLLNLTSGRIALVWNRLYRQSENSTKRTDYWPSLCEFPCSLMREQLSISFSEDDGNTWTKPVVILQNPNGASYPNIFERRPGELWISGSWVKKEPKNKNSNIIQLKEHDFIL